VTTLPLERPAAPASAASTCPMCGLVYQPGGDTCKEHGCPIAIGGCATQHCPRCGYTMPDESRSGAARLIRKLFRRSAAPRPASGSLVELPVGSSGVVLSLQGSADVLARLHAQGVAAGVSVYLLQRLPTFVIEVGETTIGLEKDVAAAIVLRPS
jgi:Fe2+ transport system protein FeoA